MMRIKNKNAVFGRYPSCDLLNNALRYLLNDSDCSKAELDAVKEIALAIHKGNGYFHKDIAESVKLIMNWAKED